MHAGLLRHRVDIEKRVITAGDTGDPVVSWAPVVRNVPARIEWVSGKEFVADVVKTSQIVARITIRWRGDVEATMRVKRRTHGATPRTAELYNIAAVLPDETGRRWLTLPVTLGVNEG